LEENCQFDSFWAKKLFGNRACPRLTDGPNRLGEIFGTTQSLICQKNECQLKFFNEITFFLICQSSKKVCGRGEEKWGEALPAAEIQLKKVD